MPRIYTSILLSHYMLCIQHDDQFSKSLLERIRENGVRKLKFMIASFKF